MRLLATLLVLAAVAAPARADEAHDLAADIVARTGSGANVGKMIDILRGQVVALMVQKSGKTPDEAASIYEEVFRPAIAEVVPRMQATLADVYARDYDIADLRALDGFYRSAAGARILAHAPEVAADTLRASLVFMQEALRRIEQQNADQLHKKGVYL